MLQLFKELLGCNEETKKQYLKKAIDDGLSSSTSALKKAKHSASLKQAFVKLMPVSSWDEANILYPDACEELLEVFEGNAIYRL